MNNRGVEVFVAFSRSPTTYKIIYSSLNSRDTTTNWSKDILMMDKSGWRNTNFDE
jgi:hypothetical protein